MKDLREIGIQPDILICRCEKNISYEEKKISLFCNLNTKNIIKALNVNSIYELPFLFSKEKLDNRVLGLFWDKKGAHPPNLKNWINITEKQKDLFVKI